jgi:predicted nucleic acid-binding protein
LEDTPSDSRFINSNAFIYVLLNDPALATKALKTLTGFEEGKETKWTSTLAHGQVFSHLKNRGKSDAIDKLYGHLEGSPINVTGTTLDDITEARKIKKEQHHHWSTWDDLVLAAQMKRLGVEEIYSNNTDFKLKWTKRAF